MDNSILPECRFQEGDAPPDVPADEFFQLEATTIFISGSSAVEMGNRLLDLLRESADMSVKKMSRAKFTIKVEAFSATGVCELKVRGYRQESGIAFEFQRRCGDAIAFNDIYHMAADVCANANASDLIVSPAQTAVPVHDNVECVDKDSPLPLLEIAASTDDSALQAEVAFALNAMSQSAQFAVQLCTPSASAAFCKLLQYCHFSIVHPMARLLYRLVQLRAAEQFFADQAMLLAMINMVLMQSLERSVREELAAVVQCAVDLSLAHVSKEAANGLAQALSGALKGLALEDVASPSIARSVQGTLDMLQCAFAL